MVDSRSILKIPGRPRNHLCSTCEKLNLGWRFASETSEQSIGNLSQYSDPGCPFCVIISKAIKSTWGTDSAPNKISGRLFIQSRSALSVKENGHIHHPQPRLLLAIDKKPDGFNINRVPLRQIDRIKNRYIIAEIERFPSESEPNYLPRLEVGTKLNIPLLQSWLEECRKHEHSKMATRRGGRGLFQPEHPFRLIDVNQECLVRKDTVCDYVALSYVWGRRTTLLFPGEDEKEIPILLSLRENVNELSIPKGLSSSRPETRKMGRIPLTIRDAIEFTRQIGMQYLWVDTLCIVQDDPEDKAQLIGRMDDVYDCAAVTIIAAAGGDADAGLRGVSPRAGHPLNPTKIADKSDESVLEISPCLRSLCEEVRGATWNTRGWVFQEQSLSQRCLYFTAEEVFFNCSEAQRREGYDYAPKKHAHVDVGIRTGPPWWTRSLRKDLDPTPYHYLGDVGGKLDIQAYQTAVQEYSRKSLTFPSDILNAFEGVFNRFNGGRDSSGLTIRQTQGIPPHLLYQALLWFPYGQSVKRLCQSEQAGDQFSTWSWVYWTGPMEFAFADSLWLSRNISQAPIKRVPLYTPIICWYYGGSKKQFWTRDIWKTTCEIQDYRTKKTTEEFRRTKSFIDGIGISTEILLDWSRNKQPPDLNCGELGFVGSYLDAGQFEIKARKEEHVKILKVSCHEGQFRFDSDVKTVDELVVIVTANTITKPPDTQSILLGLTTRDGVSRRVGIGYIYYSRDEDIVRPEWKYRFFRIQ
ncbi:HET-domain-containing protein [Daldinia caldariorum]|uniref:HET-domain-containing protein n=1 Tax=Daldinia caldariorum TaxID=326644 RepID=UPI002007C5B9|nr:HET-domain-containing protein [Daldinia caldariorum]KAI1464321.1 HET-domain-containing protein [Daldinia caldariorum]